MQLTTYLYKFIPQVDINQTAKHYNSDKYYKKFKTYERLVTMLFATMSGVYSLRELSTVFLAFELNLKKDSFIVFDKAYNDYLQCLQWILDGVYFV